MEPRVIETESQHEEYLAELERLIALDPPFNTSEADSVKLLALLIENYEKERFPFELPDPIDAIFYRMEEQGLKQRDLIPFIGSKSKVSEVLARKRPLSITMIRSLASGLGIPVEVLLQEPHISQDEIEELNWRNFPIKEIVKRNWIEATKQEILKTPEEIAKRFFAMAGNFEPEKIYCRLRYRGRTESGINNYALLAWAVRVIMKANKIKIEEYKKNIITDKFLKQVAQLSIFDNGPLLAMEFLAKHGIALVIEEHLPKTRLDGASMLTKEGKPVIGLTLRYDRLDNFWFTLMHELVHVSKHIHTAEDSFFDDLENDYNTDPIEKKADKDAREAFIPRSRWIRSDAYILKTPEAIKIFANELGIHPAIIAGRIRYETNNYQSLKNLVGQGKVRILFK